MADIIYFQPKHEISAKQNLDSLIEHCKNTLTLYDDQGGWQSNSWQHKQKNRFIAMTFSKYREKSNPANFDPLDEPFLSFAKAYIRYNQSIKSVSSVTNKMVALRMLHDALIEIHDVADILKTDGLVLGELENLTKQRVVNDDRRNKVGYQIEILLEFIRTKRIVPALQSWANPWPKVGAKAERTDKESRDWQDERCPSMHQMLALADCFANAETLEDQYWSSVITLLMFAPGRAGELSELTVDCLHRGENGALGVRWYAEKGFGHTIKWVPEALEQTVIEAHRRLMEIGKPARDAAKFAYENPNIFMRHSGCCTSDDFAEDKPLNAYQFAHAMSLTEQSISRMKSKTGKFSSVSAWDMVGAKDTKWVQRLVASGEPTYEQLASFVASEYQTQDWPYLPSIQRPVWESLILIRDREFHNDFRVREFSWRLPSVNELNAQLAMRDKLKNPPKTLFQRMGYKDEDGSDIRLTSHQIRVWLSTNAERGGMDAWQLARWAGRARINDNRHYDLRTQDEREQQARSILEFNERPTALEAIKMNLPVSYKDLGVNRIGIADVTEYGMCVHDYAMSPCIKGGECMTCKEHVCIKGMPDTLERILRLEKQVESQFYKANQDNADGVFGADRWVSHLGWKLAHIRTQRQRLESEDTPEGAILWIPPEHDPSPVKRALEQNDLDISASDQDLVEELEVAMLLGIENA
ncbi:MULTISPECIES: hypothetical protein [Shewanella]|uniref:hypothetical protein n=1 Tax=Shewanella TaxID=22 RepID=UPI0021D89B70|nr:MULTISPECIES: hypothetical protein [Shewanella]MCU8004809.1 hypothetical protein [Shewanella sp. SM96]MDI5837446.1 hypothetical protein [Shewanella xiamenensis]MDI5841658.1 hypothetical protein [Shewanella xiamenensis]MDI5845338.1 hypothetical protein [Shewanella xiamenensis]MDI5849193.1 hypothetical protein [Shewanella xiamenensis]